jgi:hypothetical protein
MKTAIQNHPEIARESRESAQIKGRIEPLQSDWLPINQSLCSILLDSRPFASFAGKPSL